MTRCPRRSHLAFSPAQHPPAEPEQISMACIFEEMSLSAEHSDTITAAQPPDVLISWNGRPLMAA